MCVGWVAFCYVCLLVLFVCDVSCLFGRDGLILGLFCRRLIAGLGCLFV